MYHSPWLNCIFGVLLIPLLIHPFCPLLLVLIASLPLGWAGYTLARELDARKYQVVVVSPRSYFVFTPLLASTSTGTLEFRTALEPVRSRRTGVEFFQGWADSVDFEKKTLSIEEAVENPQQGLALTGDRYDGEGKEKREKERGEMAGKGKLFEMGYDKLVVSVGCYSQTFGTPGVKENAYFLKDVGDARKIRNRMLSCESLHHPQARLYSQSAQASRQQLYRPLPKK